MRFRPTVARVDLDAIRHNVRTMRPPGVELMAVVKADAYGHGDLPVARAALEAGASWLAVALVEEGIRLRDAGIEAPILVLSELPPGSEKEALAARLTPSAYTEAGVRAVSEAGTALGRPPRLHVKLDTGMHRVGADPGDVVRLCRLALDRGSEIEAVWTHFAKSEQVGDPSAAQQLSRYLGALEDLAAAGIRPRFRHAANSAAVMSLPESHLDLVRVGIALYGVAPGPELDGAADLRPALSLRSRVSMTKRLPAGERVSYGLRYRLERDATIATVPVGYADGYLRAASGQARILIRERRHPVAGAITMDQVLVDVGDDPVEPGDEVVVIGRQGDEQIRVEEVGAWAGTIGYEVLTGLSPRVPREYEA
jgi:alanine racemase